jgi:hypothetical protein
VLIVADGSLRQSFAKIFCNLFELGRHGRLSIFAYDRHAAIARLAGSDIDWDLAEQRDP